MPVNAKCVPLPRKPHCQPFQASVSKPATSHFLCIMAAKWAHAGLTSRPLLSTYTRKFRLLNTYTCANSVTSTTAASTRSPRTAARMKRHAKQRQRINRKQPFFNCIYTFFRLYFFGSIESDIKIRKSLPQNKSIALPVPDTPSKEQYIHPYSPP